MHEDYAQTSPFLQEPSALSMSLQQRLAHFLAPLLKQLDAKMDVRLVRTFLATLAAILKFRNRAQGLLLSELGAYLLSPDHAPAGTKRLSNLLRCPRWKPDWLHRFLWRNAEAHRKQMEQAGEEALLIWDESVLEKKESQVAEGLCAVRSSKAARCLKVKPGFYRPPTTKPVFVPGMHWVALLLCGRNLPPCVAAMRWWSSRGAQKTSLRAVEQRLLEQVAAAWGRLVLHVFDRGFAGSPWLEALLVEKVRFVVRWPKRYALCVVAGAKPTNAWKLARGKRSKDSRLLFDASKRQHKKVGVFWREVWHPDFLEPLFLVVARQGQGHPPWYLLTNERIETKDEAWKIVLAYARRWQIEMAFRYNKSELAMESPRLLSFERREKLLLMVTLCYAFLLSLLAPFLKEIVETLLRRFCHRTGKRSQQVLTPLYRLRAAISRLWMSHPVPFAQFPSQNSG
jgi:hypothetical protein